MEFISRAFMAKSRNFILEMKLKIDNDMRYGYIGLLLVLEAVKRKLTE